MPKHYKLKSVGSALKTIGRFGLEVTKRAVSPSYYKKRVINPALGKKK